MFDEAKKRLQSFLRFVSGSNNSQPTRPPVQNQNTPSFLRYTPPQPSARPTVTPSQMPSYGSGATGIFNRAKDIFSADTPQDQYRRSIAPPPVVTPVRPPQINPNANFLPNLIANRPQPTTQPKRDIFNENAAIAQKAFNEGQAPSYGTGLSSLFNKAKDAVLADTPQDIYNRMKNVPAPLQFGAPISYKQEGVMRNRPGIVESIVKQITKPVLEIGNTIALGGASEKALARIAAARITGNKAAERKAMQDYDEFAKYIDSGNGLGGYGMMSDYSSKELGRPIAPAEVAKTIGGYGTELGSYVVGGEGLAPVIKGFNVGAKPALGALARFGGTEFAAGALGLGGSKAEDRNASYKDIGVEALKGGAYGVAGAGAFSGATNLLGKMLKSPVDETLSRLARSSTKEEVVRIAEKEGVKLNDEAADTIAKTSNKDLIAQQLTNAVDTTAKKTGQAADITAQTAKNVAAKSTNQIPTPTITDQIISTISKPKTIEESNAIVKTLFPNNLPDVQTSVATTLYQALNDAEAQTILKQAQQRSEAVSKAVQDVTPEGVPRTADIVEEAQQAAPTAVTAPTIQRTANITEVAPTGTTAANAIPNATTSVGPSTREVLFGPQQTSPDAQFDFGRKISPNRIVRENITRPIQEYLNDIFAKAQISENKLARGVGRLGTGWSREIGITPELLAARKQFLQGTVELGKVGREEVARLGQGIQESTQNRVWATLDPELAAEKGIKITVNDLTENEKAYRDTLVQVRDAITRDNLQRGLITPEQAANQEWFKRGYSVFDFNDDYSKTYESTKQNLLKQYKGRKVVNEKLLEEAITDPAYLLAKKTADSHAAWAMVDYSNWLSDNGYVIDKAKKGYRQLPDSKLYGNAAGKYVPTNIAEDFTGFQYSTGLMNGFNDFITAYDRLAIRRAKKGILTVLNPAVRAGNEVSNRVVFAQLNGINPATFDKNFARVKGLRAARDPLYLEAVERGLTGLDITQKDFANKVAEYMGEPGQATKAWNWLKNTYSQADDNARIAAYITHRERGFSADEAARLAQRGFQDYNSVGYFFDIAAKVPLVGNAFARFAGDATRMLTNAVVDQPFTLAGSVGGIYMLNQVMSRLSGETAEQKQAREDRFGAPKIPFTDISLEVQTPFGAINVARFLPYYQLNEINGAVSKFLPVSGNPLEPKNWQDPFLGQVVQLIVDKDFRNKSIKDPLNTGQFREKLKSTTEWGNRLRFLATQNVPLGREVDSIISAFKKEKDVYGSERTIPQAFARAFGIKVEQFGPDQVAELKKNEKYFSDLANIQEDLKGLNADQQEKYKKLSGYYKTRELVENIFKKGSMRFKKEPVYNFPEDKYKDLSSDPQVYDLILKQKEQAYQRDGTPIPPEFDKRLSSEFRKQLIENKSRRPGDDVEADELLYNSAEWDTYDKVKQEYERLSEQYYPNTNAKRQSELVKYETPEFPKKGNAYQQYSDAYKAYAQGQGNKPQFTDQVKADKDKYNKDKLAWTNNERKARGLAPISPDVWNNVTFGFQSDEEKVYNELRYGKGMGRFGYGRSARSGGSDSQDANQGLASLINKLQLDTVPEVKTTNGKKIKFKVKTPGKAKMRRIRLG